MAQRTEKEETEFKAVPETLTLCVNNCGVIGNQATNNMCQKCFNATTATSTSSGSGAVGINFSEKNRRSSSLRSPVRSFEPAHELIVQDRSVDAKEEAPAAEVAAAAVAVAKKEVNRCSGCRRKVGLTGFRCRCGDLFCAEHRYSDRHDCSYDYKAAGRDSIARDNPVVKAAKIVKI